MKTTYPSYSSTNYFPEMQACISSFLGVKMFVITRQDHMYYRGSGIWVKNKSKAWKFWSRTIAQEKAEKLGDSTVIKCL